MELEKHEYDVVVVGAGGAGLRAAIEAHESGARTRTAPHAPARKAPTSAAVRAPIQAFRSDRTSIGNTACAHGISNLTFGSQNWTSNQGFVLSSRASVSYVTGAHNFKAGIPNIEPGLDATSFFESTNCLYPFGTHIAVVEVDPETGHVTLRRYIAVDDCGRILNPLIVSGQVHGGKLVARALKSRGVGHLFTLSGGHLFSIYDGCRAEGIDIVDVRHESCAAFAAEGWAKVTREPGVAALTAGPGVTNGMSAIASALSSPVPKSWT